MKWIGQHIWDFISRFRGDVYIENLSTTTETDVLVVDSDGKVSKNTIEDLHHDTSSQASVDNSGSTYIQDVTLDTYGHVTGLTSAAIPTLNQDTTGTAATVTGSAQTNITSVGTLTNLQVDFINTNASTLTITDSSDTGDLFSIATTTHGATTITTVDDDAAAADLTMDVDGDIIIDSHTGTSASGGIKIKAAGTEIMNINAHHSGTYLQMYENGGASTDDYFTIDVAEHGDTTLMTYDNAASAAHFSVVADGDITLDAEGNITLETAGGAFNCDAAAVNFTGTSGDRPAFNLTNNANDATGPNLKLSNLRDGNGLEDADVLGTIAFAGEDAVGATEYYGSIIASVIEADNANEAGQIAISVANDGTERNGITMTASAATAEEVDVTIGAGAASVTTVAGTLTVGSTAFVDNVGRIQVASQPNITSVGTLTDLDIDNININGDTITASADLSIVATGDDIAVDTNNFVIESATNGKPNLELKTTYAGNKPASIYFKKDKGAAGADDDFIGRIYFVSDNDAQEQITFANISGEVRLAADGAEEGKFAINIKNTNNASLPQESFLLTANGAATDVNLGFGTTSVTTVTGTLTMGSTAAMTNAGLLSVAAQTNVTSLGTLTGLTTSGAIELGHASDTTLARSAAGRVTIEGNEIQTKNVHHHFLNAGFFLNYPYTRYIPLQGSLNEQNTATASPEYVNFTWPYDGYVKTMWLRSETDMGNTELKLYKGASGATVVTALGAVTESVSASNAVEFDFTSVTNSYSQGDTMAVRIDPTDDPDGGQNITIELIFDLTT